MTVMMTSLMTVAKKLYNYLTVLIIYYSLYGYRMAGRNVISSHLSTVKLSPLRENNLKIYTF